MRRKVAAVILCLLVVLLAISSIANPVIEAHRAEVPAQEPVVAFALWQWHGGLVFELDLQPMANVTMAPISSQQGSLQGGVQTDTNVPEPSRELKTPEPLQGLDPIGGAYYKHGVSFSEGRNFIFGRFLNHGPQNMSTQLNVYVASTSDRDVLKSGHLLTFMDDVLLKDGEFDPFERDTATSEYYLQFKDLSNSKITLLWTGSSTIHIWGATSYIVSAQSADYTEYLPTVESCVIEQNLSSYLGLSHPKLRDCELKAYIDLPPTTQAGSLVANGTDRAKVSSPIVK